LPIEIDDLPITINSMVIFHGYVKKPEGESSHFSAVRSEWPAAQCMSAAMGIPTRLPTLIREHRNGAYGVPNSVAVTWGSCHFYDISIDFHMLHIFIFLVA